MVSVPGPPWYPQRVPIIMGHGPHWQSTTDMLKNVESLRVHGVGRCRPNSPQAPGRNPGTGPQGGQHRHRKDGERQPRRFILGIFFPGTSMLTNVNVAKTFPSSHLMVLQKINTAIRDNRGFVASGMQPTSSWRVPSVSLLFRAYAAKFNGPNAAFGG